MAYQTVQVSIDTTLFVVPLFLNCLLRGTYALIAATVLVCNFDFFPAGCHFLHVFHILRSSESV